MTTRIAGTIRVSSCAEGRAKARSYTRLSAAVKDKKIDGAQIWKDFEDLLIPRLRLTVIERALYSHLLRHSRLEGKPCVRFSIPQLTRASGLSRWMIRRGLRRLVAKRVIRLVEKGKWGHTIEVRLPAELRAVRAKTIATPIATPNPAHLPNAANFNVEEADFLQTRALRQAIHAREGGRCFYCLRRTTPAARCLDHVVPRAWMGTNSFRNLVSCCVECNSKKGERRAEDFLRWLFREGHLETSELKARLRALEKLADGKLRPGTT